MNKKLTSDQLDDVINRQQLLLAKNYNAAITIQSKTHSKNKKILITIKRGIDGYEICDIPFNSDSFFYITI